MLDAVRGLVRQRLRAAPKSDRVVAGAAETLLVSFCNMPRSRQASDGDSGSAGRFGAVVQVVKSGRHEREQRPAKPRWTGALLVRRPHVRRIQDRHQGHRVRPPGPKGLKSLVAESDSGGCFIYFTASLEDSVYRTVPYRRSTKKPPAGRVTVG